MKKIILIMLLFVFMTSIALAAECEVNITSKNTKELLNEVSSIDKQVQDCPTSLDDRASKIVKNGDVDINIKMNDGSTEIMHINVENKKVTGFKKGPATKSKYEVNSDEPTVDKILASDSRGQEFMKQYADKKVQIEGKQFFSKIATWITNPFIRWGLNRWLVKQPQLPIQATIGPYENQWACEFYQVPWQGVNVKRVSCPYETPGAAINEAADEFCREVMGSQGAKAAVCDSTGQIVCVHPCPENQFEIIPQRCAYDAARKRGSQAPPLDWCEEIVAVNPESGKKKVGEVCQHGGECETGNCIYVGGQGAERTYKCSCDPFKYDAYSC